MLSSAVFPAWEAGPRVGKNEAPQPGTGTPGGTQMKLRTSCPQVSPSRCPKDQRSFPKNRAGRSPGLGALQGDAALLTTRHHASQVLRQYGPG